MEKCLVTGGVGFIGSHIAEELVRLGFDVTLIDDFSTGKRANLETIEEKIRVIEGDIRDFELLSSITRGIDYIFHQAAVVSVTKTVEDPKGSHEVNVTGTINVLEAARINKVKRVVYASSAVVYGDNPGLPKREEMAPDPISFYGEHKLINERYAKHYYEFYGLESVGLRYSNVYGPRQDPLSPYSGVISIFVNAFLNGKKLVIYGDGNQTRDFIYVKDVVSANILAMTTNKMKSGVFNVGTQKQTSLNEMIHILKSIAGKDIVPEYVDARQGDIRHSVGSTEKIKEQCGFSAEYALEDGIKILFKSS